ncbi:MAG: glycosyl transferase family 2 [Crocinitomicaceae bacterium]|nr:glycosyl transferase family 2 [Crocinitomicaceae bacterium]
MEELAIVILNWNGQNFLERFLPGVVRNSPGARIVVADNASTDDSVAWVRENFPQVELVVNASNGGYAKGYNDALQYVSAKYYLLLNSDIEVTENWLVPLYQAISFENVAAVQPKILAEHSRDFFEHAGASGGFLDKNLYPFCRGRIFNTVEEDRGQYDGETEVFWVSGACMLVRADVFHEAGGFDDAFFAHMEEIDLCWRMKRLGYSLKVVPSSVVYHVGGGTLNYNSPNKVYLNFRNNLYMITKNYQGFLAGKLFYRMILDGVASAQFLVTGNFSYVRAVLRAHGTFYRNFSKTMQKRRAFRPDKKLFNAKGFYSGSILWAFFFKGIRKFSDLNQRLFR